MFGIQKIPYMLSNTLGKLIMEPNFNARQPDNPAEKFVYEICNKSFLSLWSYANPLGKNGQELCDILVVCGNHIIIFSVKDIKFTESGDISVDWSRWMKRAIDSSCRQLYGAERWIKSAQHVIRQDGSIGVEFLKPPNSSIHRIAIALGGQNKVPIKFGDFGKGFVHVFDETSFDIILKELDTISDFTNYLLSKEKLYRSGVKTILQGAEEDILALYLHNGCKFPEGYNSLIIDNNLWKEFVKKDGYRAKKRADKDSYRWDRLLEIFCSDAMHDNLEFGPSLSDVEQSVRTMALENRFSRRILGKAFIEFMKLASQKKVRSRMIRSLNDVVYVFLAIPHGEERQFRVAELGNRCFVARGLNKDCKCVVGIATERYEGKRGFSLDLAYIYKESWTERDQSRMKFMQKDSGYFVSPVEKLVNEGEYPIS